MIVVHHNARCSKSRAVLALLEAADEPFLVVDYLASGWTRGQLLGLFAAAGVSPREALRASEARELAPDIVEPAGDDDGDREAVLAAMVRHPVLVERPIVCAPGAVAICRPPERVLELIGS